MSADEIAQALAEGLHREFCLPGSNPDHAYSRTHWDGHRRSAGRLIAGMQAKGVTDLPVAAVADEPDPLFEWGYPLGEEIVWHARRFGAAKTFCRLKTRFGGAEGLFPAAQPINPHPCCPTCKAEVDRLTAQESA